MRTHRTTPPRFALRDERFGAATRTHRTTPPRFALRDERFGAATRAHGNGVSVMRGLATMTRRLSRAITVMGSPSASSSAKVSGSMKA